MEEDRWEKIKNKLPKDYVWGFVPAEKEHKKGRAKGGIITAVRKKIRNIEVRKLNEAAMECKIEYNGKKWRIMTVYSQEIEKTMETVMKHIPEEEEEYLTVGGDLNARTGNEGGPVREEENGKRSESRRSIDKIINREGRRLISKIEERGWAIMNGSYGEEGGWTYIGERGSSVIDYVIGNDETSEEIKGIEEGNRTESDHIPLEIELMGTRLWEEKDKETEMEIERSDWTEEGVKSYQEKCEEWKSTRKDTEGIWTEIKKRLKTRSRDIKREYYHGN
ncbi:PREDICTED: uncharacterized protein LOC108768497 [Trachymyrmex cornetzi]|uniref:uncharacterized protein LOC108768497 n=1 Tax=Trachymyrmex cornetzi TaxID=471704 RepID=UPI00084F1770|nr:PREDICTED: uncharacterized protein LOC108768497 [Trachymyrmex cornetzi]